MTRDKTIKIRLTDEEHQQLKVIAGARGISGLLRNLALGNDRRQEQTERLMVVAELARARSALNQIALNSIRRPLPDQIQIVTHLIGVERELAKFKKS